MPPSKSRGILVAEDPRTCFGLSFMSDFVTSLVREKIVFLPQEAEGGDGEPTVIRSNRIYLRLVKGDVTDNVVIRAQNMADTLRMAARVVEDHMWKGPFKTRKPPWGSMWQQAVSLYGAHFNAENNWVAVYIDGKNVYETTKSPFTDVVDAHRAMEEKLIPQDVDYDVIHGLSYEVRDRLERVRPRTVGQASRVIGVTPAAISALLVHLRV